MKTLLLIMISMVWVEAIHTRPCIQIILTAALTDAHYEFRKQQYVETFSILNGYGYKDYYIIEALKKQGPTFLDEYSSHVLYAQTNNNTYCNNGVNEAATLLEGLTQFQFDDEDMILKMTARHQLTSDYFLNLIKDNPSYDAFVKVNEDGHVFTLGFAMRNKYMIEMLSGMNFPAMGHIMRPIEYDVGDYIKAKKAQGNFKVYYVPTLHMKAQIFGSSTALNAPHQLNYY